MGIRSYMHKFMQMLELSEVYPITKFVEHPELYTCKLEKAWLHFQEIFYALGQLTGLHLSNVECPDGMKL